MKRYKNLINLLNLNYLHYANKSVSKGSMDIPAICCNAEIFPDFIALYSETGLYHKTDRTAVGFFQYDDDFDGTSNDIYKCEIYYGQGNETELLINILSFGPMVKVIGSERFLKQLKERLKKQRYRSV